MIQVTVESNVHLIQAIFDGGAEGLDAAFNSGMKIVANEAKAESLKEMEPLYWVADAGLVATGRGYLGKAAAGWTRLGALRSAETLEQVAPNTWYLTTNKETTLSSILGSGELVFKEPDAYAEWRYFDGREVGSRWREKGIANVLPEIPAIIGEELARYLPNGLFGWL